MRRGWNAALIVLGGMLGTAARSGLGAAFPAATHQWPWMTFWINVIGSLFLGVLVESLAGGDDSGWRRSVRLGVGTGVLGGFTTYSTFSVETVGLLQSGQLLLGLGYAVGSVLAGIAAALAAIVVVRRLRHRLRWSS